MGKCSYEEIRKNKNNNEQLNIKQNNEIILNSPEKESKFEESKLKDSKYEESKFKESKFEDIEEEEEKEEEIMLLKNNSENEIILKNNQYNLIKEKADSFLDDKMKDENQRLQYAIEVSNYIKEEIRYIKSNSFNNLIRPRKAVLKDNYIIRFLGYIGSEFLSSYKINTYIEIIPSNEIIRDITFKIILSGLATQRIYKLIVKSNKNIERFKKNINKFYEFIRDIKNKIITNKKLKKNDIYFFNYDESNFEVNMIIYNQIFNDIENILMPFHLKVIRSYILNSIILSPNMFLINFCKKENDWPKQNLYRGGEIYYPPYGWEGFSLKLRNKFGENNDWLGKNGENENEWCVAYHGVGNGDEFKKALSILNTNLIPGPNQHLKHDKNKRKYTMNEYKKCGEGVYLAPKIKIAENYAKKTTLGKINKYFKFAIMFRVNPKKIRDPGSVPINWILNGNYDEIRPYRLLVKIK